MKRLHLITGLWVESANAQSAQRIADSNRRHRRAFPWLLGLAILALGFLYIWSQS